MTNLTQECVEEQALYEISDVYLTWSPIGTVHRFRGLNQGPHGQPTAALQMVKEKATAVGCLM